MKLLGAVLDRVTAAENGRTPAEPSDRVRASWLLLAVVPFLVLSLPHALDFPSLQSGDWAQYLMHAQALLDGRAYGDIGYLYSPRAYLLSPAQEPPGFPATLVPFLALFGRHVFVMRMVVVISGVALLAILVRYLSIRYGRSVGVGSAMMMGVAIESLLATNRLLSDVGFCALLWAALYVGDVEERWTVNRALWFTLLGGAAIAYRVAGVALLPAAIAYGIVHRRRTGMLVFMPVALWVAAGALYFAMPGHPVPFVSELLSVRYMPTREIAGGLHDYSLGALSAVLYPLPWNGANDAYHVAAMVLVVIGSVTILRRGLTSLMTAFSASYVAMLLLSPVRDVRYLWPLFPVIDLAMLLGIASVVRLIGRRPPGSEHAAALGAGAVLSLMALLLAMNMPRPPTLLGNPDFQTLVGEMNRVNASSPIRVAFFEPRVLTWSTHIPAMALVQGPPDVKLAELRRLRITHVTLGELGTLPGRRRAWQALVHDHPELFELEYRNASFELYRFDGDRTAPQ